MHKILSTLSVPLKIQILAMTMFLFNCAATIKTSTLDYYKIALVSVDESVKAGMEYEVTMLPKTCYKDDACIEQHLRKWFVALSTITIASKYLQTAYANQNTEDSIKALVCSVSKLREVNTLLLSAQMALPKDYQSFFIFLDSQAKGMICLPEPPATQS